MGLFSKVEDRPTPPSVYNARVYIAAAVMASAAIMIGMTVYPENLYANHVTDSEIRL